MPDSTTTAERKLTVKPFPSLEDLEKRIGKPLDVAHNAFQDFSMFLRNVTGEIPGAQWEARLVEPPTVENIGTVTIIVDHLEMTLEWFSGEVAILKGLTSSLDQMRLDGDVGGFDDRKEG